MVHELKRLYFINVSNYLPFEFHSIAVEENDNETFFYIICE